MITKPKPICVCDRCKALRPDESKSDWFVLRYGHEGCVQARVDLCPVCVQQVESVLGHDWKFFWMQTPVEENRA